MFLLRQPSVNPCVSGINTPSIKVIPVMRSSCRPLIVLMSFPLSRRKAGKHWLSCFPASLGLTTYSFMMLHACTVNEGAKWNKTQSSLGTRPQANQGIVNGEHVMRATTTTTVAHSSSDSSILFLLLLLQSLSWAFEHLWSQSRPQSSCQRCRSGVFQHP